MSYLFSFLHIVLLLIVLQPGIFPWQAAPDDGHADEALVVEDFSSYEHGDIPTGWKYLSGRSLKPVTDRIMQENEYFEIKEEDDRRFVRAHTDGEVARIIMPNEEDGLGWDITKHPRLRWDWRVVSAPEDAREDDDDLNDTPAAVYVTFSVNFFGIPKSIKYTYSSTLPVGTVVKFTGLRVLVVASGKDGFGDWLQTERNVADDYRQLYRDDPPRHPLSIALWSDSDTTGDSTDADFDNLVLLPSKES